MSKRLGPLVFVSVLLVIGLVVWFWTHDTQLVGPEDRPETPAGTHSTPATTSSTPLEAGSTGERATVQPTEEGPRLTVVAREGGRPLAGVELVWVDEDHAAQAQEARLGPREDLDSLYARFGVRLTTDAQGQARLPHSSQHALVLARQERLSGRLNIMPDMVGELRLELGPAREVFVRVRSPAGATVPAVPLALYDIAPGHVRVLARSQTDAQGVARFQHPEVGMARANSPRVQVGFDFPLPALLHTPVPGPNQAEAPIELQLPPHGSLRVRVVRAAGVDTRAAGRVSLASTKLPAPLQSLLAGDAAELVRGEALCPWVGLGLELSVRLDLEGRPIPLQSVGAGPKLDGEEAVLDVRLGVESSVRLKLLAQDGSTVAAQPVVLRLQTGNESTTSDVRTGADGSLRCALTAEWAAGQPRALHIELKGKGQAVVDLARELPPGESDLGDVRLGAAPLLAEGRVVDNAGKPVAGASVHVEQLSAASEPGGEEHWIERDEEGVTSAADGRFQIFWSPDEAQRALRPTKQGMVSALHRKVTPGERGIELLLSAGGVLEGLLRAPEGFDLSYLTVGLEHEGASPHALDQSRRKSAHIEPDGRFRFGELEAGRWTLTVRQTSADPVARQENIEIAPGSTTTLPPIDLNRTLRKLRIEVVDERGTPLSEAMVMIASREKSGRQNAAPVGSGVYEALAGDGGLDLSIECDGYAPVRLEGVTTSQRVVLAEGIAVRIIARGSEPLSDGARTIGLRFDNVDPTAKLFSRRGRGFEGYFAQGREFGSKAPMDGLYRATWIVRTEKEGMQSTLSLEPAGEATYEITHASPKTTYELMPPAGILERAKAKLTPSVPR